MATSPYYPAQAPKWSPAEKAAARKAFDFALRREFDAVIAESKRRAAKIQQPSDLWELEHYLTESRKHIDREYDYRYSILVTVFARLILQGRLTEQELHGLDPDKFDSIRRLVKLMDR